jgi:hypothetical protein
MVLTAAVNKAWRAPPLRPRRGKIGTSPYGQRVAKRGGLRSHILDAYGATNLGGLGDLGDPFSNVVNNVKAQVAQLRQGITLSAAASTAAALAAILLLFRTRR